MELGKGVWATDTFGPGRLLKCNYNLFGRGGFNQSPKAKQPFVVQS